MIDFASSDSHLLLNPRLPDEERQRLERLYGEVRSMPAHVWLATSGTSGAVKLVGLSKKALLASAEAVNVHLGAEASDVWCCVLPQFHVGGLGIYARAFLSDAHVRTETWQPSRFAEGGFTLAALVPAQVRDLVSASLRSPSRVRAIVVGGGAMPDDLYRSARQLGWPVLPSYGLTEAASQVATARGESADLVVLPHMEVRIDGDRIALRGPSLLTGYAMERQFVDPKAEGWFVTEDHGELRDRILQVYGRGGDFVKIGGESVDLIRLDQLLDSLRDRDAALVAVPDERLGHVIHLATTAEEAGTLVERFNERVLPFEKIRAVRRVAEIPRTALGKVRRNALVEMLQ